MTNGNDYANPAKSDWHTEGGLTKREYFAAMAMQGIGMEMVNGGKHELDISISIARKALRMADALIAELNKTESK
jgi:hypothetical protein